MDIDRAVELLKGREGEIITIQYGDVNCTWEQEDFDQMDRIGLPHSGIYTGRYAGVEFHTMSHNDLFILIDPEDGYATDDDRLIFLAKKEVIDIV